MKLEFPQLIFEKYSNVRFYENPSNGSRVNPCGLTVGLTGGQTHKHDETDSRFSQF